MKRLFNVIIILIYLAAMETNGQNILKNYPEHWKRVDIAMDKGLPKTALETVRQIYEQAKKDKQEAQLIKAVAYMIVLTQKDEDNAAQNQIRLLEKEITGSSGIVKSVLTGLLATKYQNYYGGNWWQLSERSEVAGPISEDIETWTTKDFHRKITALYLESIRDAGPLQKARLEKYNALLTKGNARKLRPTLYDILANNALEYFSSGELERRPASKAFPLNAASHFDPAADFVHRKIETPDSIALEYRAMELYQQLIAFHLNDPLPDALIDVDLNRLNFLRSQSVHPEREQLYYHAVNHIAHQYESTPAAAQAWFVLAAWHNKAAWEYKPDGDTTNRYEKVKALEICRKVVKENPETEGGANAQNLLNEILSKSLMLETETVVVPEKPFLASITYTNVVKVHFRLIKASSEMKASVRAQRDDAYWGKLIAAKPIRSWEQVIPDTKDYQSHRVEVKIDALPVGEYMLLACPDADFASYSNTVAARLVTVSAISFIKKDNDYFVLNRDSGQPIARAQVRIWKVRNDRYLGITAKIKSALYNTDLNGYFRKTKDTDTETERDELLEITAGNDHLALDGPGETFYSNENDEPQLKIHLFTDRALYRPGQTVYYKGIVTEKESVLQNSSDIPVILFNANSEEVSEQQVRTNAYGSFAGTFQLPKNALNGEFRITAAGDHEVSFQVEEYKRPRFEVTFDTLKNTYKIGDKILVTGNGLGYAGNAIDGAKVSYRVERVPRFVYPWVRKRHWMPASAPMEITHGDTVTDANGKFHISFEAIPDLKIDKKLDPVFDYLVHADVTDSNGETRSNSTTISVSYQSILLKTDIPEKVTANNFNSLSIRTENMNGAFETSEVKVKIVRTKPENRLIRKRYWNTPDQFVMSQSDFVASFPNDEYNRESDPESWPEAKTVLDQSAILENGKPFKLSGGKFETGFYKIEISVAGKDIKDIRYVELTNPDDEKLSRPQYLWTEGSKPIEPGETTQIRIGSSAEKVFVIHSSNKNPDAGSFYQFLAFNDQKSTFNFTASEANRGGYTVDYIFVKHNRLHQYRETIEVPFTNKQLHIEYLSFRDKTLPGSAEKWKVKISGYQKEKVAAEMLATMYDASLDQFHKNPWTLPTPIHKDTPLVQWWAGENFHAENAQIRYGLNPTFLFFEKKYDRLNLNIYHIERRIRRRTSFKKSAAGAQSMPAPMAPMEEEMASGGSVETKKDEEVPEELFSVVNQDQIIVAPEQSQKEKPVAARTNLKETAFFLPELYTNKDGEIEFSFTLPEALTRWKFQALAHTKELAFGYSMKEIVTRKELMVQPNPPRFLREGDRILFPVKIVNLSDHELQGNATLELFDTETNESVANLFGVSKPEQPFKIGIGQSTAVEFEMVVPKGYNRALTWRALAKAGNLSDGEEDVLPVLPNRMLVTESLPLQMRGTGKREFKFEKLLNAASSKTLAHESITVEYTSNPAWYAVQSLPYLMEYPYECAEQTWNRYYANALASFILKSSPKIATVFESWKTLDANALASNLQKNEELKSVLLEETPWVLEAKSESEQKRNITLLFNLVKMQGELNANLQKLKEMQSESGGFPWFKGGRDDRYITQYIVSGIGNLIRKKVVSDEEIKDFLPILEKAFPYLDKSIRKDYDQLIKSKAKLTEHIPTPLQVQYLYMRTQFDELPIMASSAKALDFFTERAKATWMRQSKYLQGMIALTQYRSQDAITPKAILKSLRETAIRNDELGMHWTSRRGWWWHEAPIEQQALLIETFQEISGDRATVDDLKTWLLKNKQTNNWESTKATADACYALIMTGSDWLLEEKKTVIRLGSEMVKTESDKTQEGTGYFKKSLRGSELRAEMGNVEIELIEKNANDKSTSASWGAVYWQYFEELDKITFSETPLKLAKKLFVEKNTDNGPSLFPVNEGDRLKVGDKVVVRVELRSDRDMEYVHMKDLRAASFEPVNVLSGYKWQDGLGYYETTKDASTNFFFDHLRKGTYVFEYALFVNHEGEFSNGITTIQCMYAPEFSAHSEGIRIKIAKD